MKGIVSVMENMLKARDREAFINEARYKEPKRCSLYEFNQWVSSMKTHHSAMHAFVEFECRFAQLSERDQRLVGDDKVLMFVKSINRNERKAIGIQLEDDDGGLTEDWTKVERICRLHDERKTRFSSTTTQPMRNVQRRTGCGNTPPLKEESLKREDSILNIEALIKEALEKLKVQDDAEEKFQKEKNLKQMVIEEEEASQQMRFNVTADTNMAPETFSSCKERLTKNETKELRVANATSSEDKCFGKRIVSETSSDEGTSMSKACMIKGDKKCEANLITEIAMKNDIESEVAEDESMADGCVETFSTLVPETWAVASKRQRETQETEGGGEEVKAKINTCKEEGRVIEACSIKRINEYKAHESKKIVMKNDIKPKRVDDDEETFPTKVLETWALTDVRPKRQKVAAKKQRLKLIRTTIRWKWQRVARQRQCQITKFLHTRLKDLGINRCKTQKKDDGGEEARVKANVSNKEVNQSKMTNVHVCEKETKQSSKSKDVGQVGQMDLEDVIIKSDKDDTSMEDVRRVYHETRKSEKHEMWSLKDLKESMKLNNELLRVLNHSISIRFLKDMHGTRKNDKRKLDDQGDGRDEGGTCTRNEALCSRGAKRAMTTGHGNAKSERRIWWIGWQWRFGYINKKVK